MDTPDPAAGPIVFALRNPARDHVELVIGHNHKAVAYRLSFNQLRCLVADGADYLAKWPVKEA